MLRSSIRSAYGVEANAATPMRTQVALESATDGEQPQLAIGLTRIEAGEDDE